MKITVDTTNKSLAESIKDFTNEYNRFKKEELNHNIFNFIYSLYPDKRNEAIDIAAIFTEIINNVSVELILKRIGECYSLEEEIKIIKEMIKDTYS